MSNNDEKARYAARVTNPYRLEAIRKFAGRSFLDVGCGSGAYVLALADEYDAKGVDFQPYYSWRARQDLFSVSDAAELPWPDKSVDTILSFETLEHLPDPNKALREYQRVCRNNVILTVPNCDITEGMKRSNLIYGHWVDRTHIQFYNMDSITDLVRSAGFNVAHKSYINEITLMPLILEVFGLSGSGQRIVAKLMHSFRKQRYHITCLVVGERQA